MKKHISIFLLALAALCVGHSVRAGVSSTNVVTGQVVEANHINYLISDLVAGKFYNSSGAGSLYAQIMHDGTNALIQASSGDLKLNAPSGQAQLLQINGTTVLAVGGTLITLSQPLRAEQMGIGGAYAAGNGVTIYPMAAQTGANQNTLSVAGTFDTEATSNATAYKAQVSINHAATSVFGADVAAATGTSTGTVTNAYGLSISGMLSGSGTVTNNYGIYLPANPEGTNRWPIFADGTDPSAFVGGINAGGASQFSSSINVDGQAQFNGTNIETTGHVRSVDGTAGTPSFSWTADTDTGFYRAGSGNVVYMTDGSNHAQMSASGTRFYKSTAVGTAVVAANGLTVVPMATMTGVTQNTLSVAGTADTDATSNVAGAKVSQAINHTTVNAYGLDVNAMNESSTGIATTAYGISVSGAISGSVTNNYGIYVGPHSIGTARYPLYIDDADDPSVMGGGVKLKTAGAGSTTLNHYEEGTMSPRIYYTGGGYSDVSTGASKFVKTGKSMNASGYIIWSGCTSGSCTGNIDYIDMQVGAAGYALSNTANYFTACNIFLFNAAFTGPVVNGQLVQGTDNIQVYQVATTGTATQIPADTAANIIYACNYTTD